MPQTYQLTNITFMHSNWCQSLGKQSFDGICSNPPYIDATDPHLQQGGVQHEPTCALIAAEQGFRRYQSHCFNRLKRTAKPAA